MNNKILIVAISTLMILTGCSTKLIDLTENMIDLTENKLKVVNREIASTDASSNAISINAKEGVGLAYIEDAELRFGTFEIDIKGENNPGRSFVGVAFNIQNDTTYEAIYFRPFNFQSEEKIRREHSVQYISVPKYDWRILRTNHEGQFEAEYDRQPSPDDWFTVKIKVEEKRVVVYDRETDQELLSVKRLQQPISNRIALWAGNGSKGSFRNLKIK